MPQIEANGIAGEKSAHEKGKFRLLGAEQEVEVVGHQAPRQACRICFDKEFGQVDEKAPAIPVIEEDIALLDAPNHDVLQQANRI